MTSNGAFGHFPLFVPCAGRIFLVVGGGRVALRRVRALMGFDFSIRVVSPEALEEIASLADAGRIKWRRRPFETGDLEGAFLATACTDDREVNRRVGVLCRERGIPVSVADAPEECDYYFPAVALTKSIAVGITGNGSDHRAVAGAAEKVRNALNENDSEAL